MRRIVRAQYYKLISIEIILFQMEYGLLFNDVTS